jgi:hypothetical protein
MPPWSAAWTSRDPSGTAERARLPSPRSTAPKDNAGPGLGGVIAALLLSVGGRAANVTVAGLVATSYFLAAVCVSRIKLARTTQTAAEQQRTRYTAILRDREFP